MSYYRVASYQIDRLRDLLAEYERERKSAPPSTARAALIGARLAGAVSVVVELAEPEKPASAEQPDGTFIAREGC